MVLIDPFLGKYLYRASKNGKLKTVIYLLKQGAPVDWRSDADDPWRRGATPLWIAAENGHISIVRLLIETGANINMIAGDGFTPLIVAAYYGRRQVARIIMQNGNADLNHRCTFGGNAEDWFRYKRNYLMADWIKTRTSSTFLNHPTQNSDGNVHPYAYIRTNTRLIQEAALLILSYCAG